MGLPDQHMSGAGSLEAGWTGLPGRVTGLRLLTGDTPGDTVTVKSFGYDEHGRLSQVINSSGIPQRFTYDDAGRMTGWQDRNGNSYAYTYDQQGRAVQGSGSGGILNTVISYGDDRVTRVTDALGHTTEHVFNELKQLVAVTDPLGNTTRNEWDRYDRLLSRTDPLGRTTRYTYDEAGNTTSITLPDGSRSTATYNDLNRPLEVVDVVGRSWRYTYDEAGNLTSTTNPADATTRYENDEHGNPIAVTDPLSNTTRTTFNAAGLPVQITDALGSTTRITWDLSGRPAEVHDPVGGAEIRTWTAEGNPASHVLPSGATETWEYDGEGNLTRHTDASGRVTVTQYGPLDLPITRTGPDGATVRFDYDGQMRLIQVTNPQGLVWRYEYDPAGNLVSETDFNGRTLIYTYDQAGQLTARTNGLGEMITYTRDRRGRTAEKRVADQVTTFTYTPDGLLQQAVSPDADLRLDYDPLGRVTAETCNGRTLTSSFDLLGRRSRRRTPSGAESVWTYDAAGRPLALATGGQTLTFTHDAAGRETQRTVGSVAALTQTWTTDHRLQAQSLWHLSTPQPAEPTAPGEPTLLQHRAYSYQPSGDITAMSDRLAGDRRYDLDPAGRVTAVHARGWTEQYAYDTAGNLTNATWPTSEPRAGTAAGAVHSQADAAADETGDRGYAGTLITRAGRIRYEHDAQGRVILRQHARLSSKPLTWRYHWDPEDRLTAIQLAWHHTTTLWGNPRYRNDSGPGYCPLRFPGQYHDTETGLNYNHHRYYDPATGRYTTTDPLGLTPGPNPHAYVPNPLSWIDPLGLAADDSYNGLDDDTYSRLEDQYGPEVADGVDHNFQRMADGTPTAPNHRIPTIDRDADALAKYFADWQSRGMTHVDTKTGAKVAYDDTHGVLIVQTPYRIHGYTYPRDNFGNGRYVTI